MPDTIAPQVERIDKGSRYSRVVLDDEDRRPPRLL
jgi:hypothetical protein